MAWIPINVGEVDIQRHPQRSGCGIIMLASVVGEGRSSQVYGEDGTAKIESHLIADSAVQRLLLIKVI